MILPDVNILLYAYDKTSPFNLKAVVFLEDVLSNDQVIFTWQTLTGFIRIITHPKASKNPLKIETAVEIVASWLELPNTQIISLDKRNWQIYADLLIDGQAPGALAMDAHLAAIANSCGARVATKDNDFTHFLSVKFFNPLTD